MGEDHKSKTVSGKNYEVGNIGANARVAIGEHITWTENNFVGIDQGAELARLFTNLLQRIEEDAETDDDTRELSIEKTCKVAEELGASAKQEDDDPEGDQGSGLRRALMDAKSWLADKVSWAWEELKSILNSEAAQKTISNITSTVTKSAIQALIGRP